MLLNVSEKGLQKTKFSGIKAVIFDLDNTLIDFLRMKEIAVSSAIDAMIKAGLHIPKQKALDILYELYREKGIEDHYIFQKFLRKVTGKVNYRKLAYAIVAYRNARTHLLHPYSKTKETLMKLKDKDLMLGIISDAPKIKVWIRLAAMRLDDFFDIVVASSDKPARMPFEKALKKLGVEPSECLMVGDRPEKDIKGAKKLGMKTCFASYGYVGKKVKVKADYSINKIEDLVKII